MSLWVCDMISSQNLKLLFPASGYQLWVRWSNKWNSWLSILSPKANGAKKVPSDGRREKFPDLFILPASILPYAWNWFWRVTVQIRFSHGINSDCFPRVIPRWFDLSLAYSRVGESEDETAWKFRQIGVWFDYGRLNQLGGCRKISLGLKAVRQFLKLFTVPLKIRFSSWMTKITNQIKQFHLPEEQKKDFPPNRNSHGKRFGKSLFLSIELLTFN